MFGRNHDGMCKLDKFLRDRLELPEEKQGRRVEVTLEYKKGHCDEVLKAVSEIGVSVLDIIDVLSILALEMENRQIRSVAQIPNVTEMNEAKYYMPA